MPNEAAYRIEFFSRRGLRGRKHYFRIRAANGEPVGQSEAYSRKIDAIQTAAHLRGGLIEARMFDMDAGGSEVE